VIRMEFYRPSSLDDALRYLSECAQAQGSPARPIAGGTDLIVSARHAATAGPAEQPAGWRVVDISGLPEISGICAQGDEVCIGAATTHTEIEESGVIANEAPFLAEAAATIGSRQIRNRATIGGNVMNASPAADTLPPLVALDATATLASVRGRRAVPVAELVTGPYKTVAAPDELLVDVRFRALEPGAQSVFIKVGRRRALAISRLAAAVAVLFDSDAKIVDTRISAGAAFPTPCRIGQAEQVLLGNVYSAELAEQAGHEAAHAMVRASGVRWSTEYKQPVLSAIITRAIRQCAAKEGVDVWPE
jgi:CO/xanthine dehydrogenase FAD-binding subunit